VEINRGTSPDEIEPSIFDINSWQGQRRKMAEIKRRLSETDQSVWEDLPEFPTSERALVLYYCCLKTYPLPLSSSSQSSFWRLWTEVSDSSLGKLLLTCALHA